MRVVIKPGGIFLFRPKSQAAEVPHVVGVSKPVDISRLYNVEGIYTDGIKFTKGLDGINAALSGTILTTSQTWNSTKFTLGPPNVRNVVVAAGQQIALPQGNYAKLYMLATTAGSGSPLSALMFTATYTDGTNKPITQGMSDWFTPLNYPGESMVVNMPYRNHNSGIKDMRPFHIYGYAFPLDSTKTVKSFTLPNQSEVKILAITLGP